MRITPVNFNIFNPTCPKKNNHNDYSQYGVLGISSLKADTVCFKGKTAQDIVILKKLLAYQIPDMYTGKIMIDPQEVRHILQAKIFSLPLKSLIKVINKYEASLFPVEKEIYSMVKQDAKKFPNMRLEDVLHRRIPDAMADLRQKQAPIFEKLNQMAQNLPPELLKEFNELMAVTNSRLYDKDIIIPFSAKEFRYKLDRFMPEIKSRGIHSEIKVMKKLLNMSKSIPENHAAVSENYIPDKTRQIAGKLRQMTKVIMQSPLAENKELNKLMMSTKSRLYNIPVVEPFSRKVFIHELQKILAKQKNLKLTREMEKIAVKLPTAKEEVSAFIMKSALNSSEKIGYDLISESIGTAEHILPALHGGEDILNNLALATAFANNERAHRRMSTQLQKHPESYENCQKYIDRLIELSNNGTFTKLGLNKWYIKNFADKMYKMSPPDKPMKLDLDKLF